MPPALGGTAAWALPSQGEGWAVGAIWSVIKRNPWSAVKCNGEKLTSITPTLDPLRAIYKHQGREQAGISLLLSRLHFVRGDGM